MLRPIVLAYAPSRVRADLAALLDLDETLGRVVASTTEPMIGQMRLTWWHERLAALGRESAPAEPVLGALNDTVAQGVVTSEALAAMVEGWEALLEPVPLDDVALRSFSEYRGNALFAIAANICDQPVAKELGAGWALIDFAMHCSDHGTAVKAILMARDCFKETKISGPKPLRIIAHVARTKANKAPESIREAIDRFTILKAVLR